MKENDIISKQIMTKMTLLASKLAAATEACFKIEVLKQLLLFKFFLFFKIFLDLLY